MKIKRALILHKRSVYSNYFLSKKSSVRHRFAFIPSENRSRLQQVHKQHNETIRIIEDCLKKHEIDYRKSTRGRAVDYSRFDLIITVGGDGTFLEGARNSIHQPILGVNSSPEWSVGNFCAATAKTFPAVMRKILEDRFRIQLLPRLRIKGIPKLKNVNILNDVLIAHANPAATSRYNLTVKGQKEEHRSSGLWISTAAGSTGAMRSAGGKILPPTSTQFQFLCREIYYRKNAKHRLAHGLLAGDQSIRITSLMREGMIFIDGSRLSVPFSFGETITITGSPVKLKSILIKGK